MDPRCLADEEYAKKALIRFAKLDEASADQLLNARDWRRRFETAWQQLDNNERDEALYLDYDFWDNYWPGFDSFNCTHSVTISSPRNLVFQKLKTKVVMPRWHPILRHKLL
jgi:hypothetical protein